MGRKELIEELKKLAEPALAKDPKDRTYRDRYCIWEYEHYKKDSHRIEDYDEGEEVEIYDGTALANNEIKDGFGDSTYATNMIRMLEVVEEHEIV